jgi:hypothetical protein
MHRETSHDAIGGGERHRVCAARDVAGGVYARHGSHLLGVGSDDRSELGVIQLAPELLRNLAIEARSGADVERVRGGESTVMKLD